jgi:hypothetical protein
MCGIIAVVPRPLGRIPPGADLFAWVEDALPRALEAEAGDPASRLEGLRRSCEQLEVADAQLRGSGGLRWMLDNADRLEALDRRAGEFEAWLAKIEDRMDAEAAETLVDTAEQTNEALVRLKDGLWRIRRDRIAGAWAVATLAGPDREGPALEGFTPPATCGVTIAWRSEPASQDPRQPTRSSATTPPGPIRSTPGSGWALPLPRPSWAGWRSG